MRAHKRMQETLDQGQELPFEISGNMIYYMGPSPAREGRPIGSAGLTTASRMDRYTPTLLDMGLGGMIGKGKRSKEVVDAIVRNGSVYFAAVGGAGALLSKCILSSEVVAYDDLGRKRSGVWKSKIFLSLLLLTAKEIIYMRQPYRNTGGNHELYSIYMVLRIFFRAQYGFIISGSWADPGIPTQNSRDMIILEML